MISQTLETLYHISKITGFFWYFSIIQYSHALQFIHMCLKFWTATSNRSHTISYEFQIHFRTRILIYNCIQNRRATGKQRWLMLPVVVITEAGYLGFSSLRPCCALAYAIAHITDVCSRKRIVNLKSRALKISLANQQHTTATDPHKKEN